MKTIKLSRQDEQSLRYLAQVMNEFYNDMIGKVDTNVMFVDEDNKNITAITFILLQNMGRVVEKYKQVIGIT
jgi:hypothetical protein